MGGADGLGSVVGLGDGVGDGLGLAVGDGVGGAVGGGVGRGVDGVGVAAPMTVIVAFIVGWIAQ